jgi:hypothetical protein
LFEPKALVFEFVEKLLLPKLEGLPKLLLLFPKVEVLFELLFPKVVPPPKVEPVFELLLLLPNEPKVLEEFCPKPKVLLFDEVD